MRIDKATVKAIKNAYSHDACAYLYPDGILVRLNQYAKLGKEQIKVETWRAFYGEIRCDWHAYNGDGYDHDFKRPETWRIVVHNPSLIFDGITRVAVAEHSTSEACRNKGIDGTSITLETEGGMNLHFNKLNVLSCDLSPQRQGIDYISTPVETLAETCARMRKEGDRLAEYPAASEA